MQCSARPPRYAQTTSATVPASAVVIPAAWTAIPAFIEDQDIVVLIDDGDGARHIRRNGKLVVHVRGEDVSAATHMFTRGTGIPFKVTEPARRLSRLISDEQCGSDSKKRADRTSLLRGRDRFSGYARLFLQIFLRFHYCTGFTDAFGCANVFLCYYGKWFNKLEMESYYERETAPPRRPPRCEAARDLDSMHVFMPFLLPKRTDNEAVMNEVIDLKLRYRVCGTEKRRKPGV